MLKKYIFFIGILALGDILYCLDISTFVNAIVWFFIIFLLGFLPIASHNRSYTIELRLILYSVGLSISIIYAAGIILNSLGLITSRHMLTPTNIVLELNLLYMFILLLCRKHIPSIGINRSYLSPKYFLYCLFLILPVLSILGANQLNNNGAGVVSLISLSLSILTLVLGFFIRKPGFKLYALYFAGLSLVLSFTMRSKYFLGFDINQEFRVLGEVLRSGTWSPSQHIGNAYYACLSITILPTIFISITHIDPSSFFKIIMPFIISFIPLIVYYIGTKGYKLKSTLAYCGSVFFLIQNQFIFQLPALNRQGVALFLFSLMVLAMFDKNTKIINYLFLIFSGSMIISHYSTAYISVVLFIITFILYKFIYKNSNESERVNLLSLNTILIMILMTFLWYFLILSSTGNLTNKVEETAKSLVSFSDSDNRSNFVREKFFIGSSVSPVEAVNEYSKSRDTVANSNLNSSYVFTDITPRYITNNKTSSFLVKLLNIYIPGMGKIILILGLVSFILLNFIKKKSTLIISLSIASSFLFIIFIAIPAASRLYNIERLYQQILIIISPSIAVIVTYLNKKQAYFWKIIIISTITLYATSTTFLAHKFLLNYTAINLGNKNIDYDHFYVTKAEIRSLKWSEDNSTVNEVLHFDKYSVLPAWSYTNIDPRRFVIGLLPSDTYKGYVYVSRSNNRGYTYADYLSYNLAINYPKAYYELRKNTIYAAGESNLLR